MVEPPAALHPVATPAPVAVTDAALEDDAALKAALESFWRANTVANAAGRQAEAAKKALATAMAQANSKRVSTNVALENGAVVPVVAEVTAEPGEVVSVAKLRGLVDDETFMKIVSATKTAVTQHAGTNVLIQSTVTVVGNESLKIRKVSA
jgi:hypothetical protein